jgi:hypothetical protein
MEDEVFRFRTRLVKTIQSGCEKLPYFRSVNLFTSLPRLGRWKKLARSCYLAPSRTELHRYVSEYAHGEKILYLEFGVFEGESIKDWLQFNSNPDSQFVGFDTFKGLPETWQRPLSKMKEGTFNAGGRIPTFHDRRCSFGVGMFQTTLRPFVCSVCRSHFERIVVHMDADLYSATLYALAECNSLLLPGDIVIFDEIGDVLNEFRALEDWGSAYLRKYEIVAMTRSKYKVAIRITV